MATRFGYPHLSLHGAWRRRASAARIVSLSLRHHADVGTGHIHPMKLLVGLAKAGGRWPAPHLFEQTKAQKIESASGTAVDHHEPICGTITTERVLDRVQCLYRQSRAGQRLAM
ncbi:hypothetical protein [Ensifer canadensis]